MRYRWILFLAGLLLISSVLLLKSSWYHIFLHFLIPEYTAYIEVDELAHAIKTKEVVVLDTRSLEEYKVSHIPLAIWVGYEAFDPAKVNHLQKDICIVVYCSVGYRSDLIGRRLQEEGYSCVRNLYGGVFEWVNEGYSVYTDGKKTENIYPYSSLWGIWLSEGNKFDPE